MNSFEKLRTSVLVKKLQECYYGNSSGSSVLPRDDEEQGE